MAWMSVTAANGGARVGRVTPSGLSGSVRLRPDPRAEARASAHHAASGLLLQVERAIARGDPAGLLLDARLARRSEAPLCHEEPVVSPLLHLLERADHEGV